MRFAAALSEHPVPTQAVGEVVGQVLEQLGTVEAVSRPDLAVLFVTAAHTGAIDDIANAVRIALAPAVLVGATAVSVLAGAREVEEHPAISLWAGQWGRAPQAFRLAAHGSPEGWEFDGLPDSTGTGETLLLLADPFSFPADAFVDHLAERRPGLTTVGGMASAARGPGGNRLVFDGSVSDNGAIGVLLPPEAATVAVVSQGCDPLGDPMIVTKAERNVIYELAGQPALERLLSLAQRADDNDRERLQRGLHVGLVVDEQRPTFERGDFLVRNVLGADRDTGAIAIGDNVEVGTTVQFHVRDAHAADEDLRALLQGRRAAGALVFTCNGRGTHLFGRPDHDAELVAAAVDRGADAGMFCAGEIGPVGHRSFLHGFTASVLLFGP